MLRRFIASGGMAQVWEADDLVLGRSVATKILHPHLVGDTEFVHRFRNEAKAAARLSHQSIVAIYDTVSEPGIEAIVMELIEGMTLRTYLDEYETLSLPDALDLTRQVGAALEAAHTARLVHRDIKPGNILLCPDRRVKVTDFGIAKALEDGDHTAQGTLLGTAKYLAPEQVEGGAVDARTDVYSLGIVLYEALTGTAPFVAPTDSATALARLRVDPRPLTELNPALPDAVNAVVLQALGRHPDQRWPSAQAFVDALAGALDDGVASTAVPLAGATMSGVAPPSPDMAPDPTMVGVVPGIADIAVPTEATTAQPTPIRQRPRIVVPLLVVGAILGSLGLGVALIAATSAGRSFVEGMVDGLTNNNDAPQNNDDASADSTAPTDQAGDDAASAVGSEEVEGGGEALIDAAGVAEGSSFKVVEVLDFDPLGDNAERPGRVANVVDADPSTSWVSESYDNRAMGNLKEGVGLIFVLDDEATIHGLEVKSPTQGWAGQVFAADAPLADIAAWGDSLDGRTDVAGDTSFDLRGVRANAVLLWITDLGDAPPRVRIEISEITLS